MLKFTIIKKLKNIQNNIKMVYNLPYTPEFNPIQPIFNKLKTEFRKISHKNIKEEITYCLNKIYKEDVNNCINHSLKIINTYR